MDEKVALRKGTTQTTLTVGLPPHLPGVQAETLPARAGKDGQGERSGAAPQTLHMARAVTPRVHHAMRQLFGLVDPQFVTKCSGFPVRRSTMCWHKVMSEEL